MSEDNRYRIVEEDRGLRVELNSTITASLLIRANKALLSHETFEDKKYQLWDFSEASNLDLDSESIRQLAIQDAEGARLNPDMIVLLVGPNQLVNGVSKIYNLYSQVWDALNSHTFPSVEEARNWIHTHIEA